MKRGLFTSCTAVSMGIAFAAAAQQVTVTGCAESGVENGCIVMKDGDKLYNITRATPKPTANTYGTVTGTASGGIDLCQQGTLLTAAQWKPDASKVCGNTQ
ncbi:hypothetical protein [Mesorhizobium sp. LNHC229A00]|uniref:hypothetical protein n=1 Tax=Mesorhizobium sp. LNHC229A00 TaxID=1287240 RepID=UPI0003CF5D46|nr:hypothetical protein [Mesorhizobium sp. LNHC229A00]ESY92901.1 hypothetical protein X741_18215 [Mesorhizobium sp. LNHC229A00]